MKRERIPTKWKESCESVTDLTIGTHVVFPQYRCCHPGELFRYFSKENPPETTNCL